MRVLQKIADYAVFGIVFVAASVMVASTFLQVFFRYVMGSPLYWSEEIGRYCFVYIVFLGGAWAGRNAAHLGVDYIVSKLPAGAARVIDLVIDILVMGFSLVIVVISCPVIRINMRQFSPALGIPMGLVYLAIPIGFLLIFVYYFCHMADHARILAGKQPLHRGTGKEGGTC